MNTSLIKSSYEAVSIAEGFCDFQPTEEQVVAAWQYLHDTRTAYQLQGWFGRQAQDLLQAGIIHETQYNLILDGEIVNENPLSKDQLESEIAAIEKQKGLRPYSVPTSLRIN